MSCIANSSFSMEQEIERTLRYFEFFKHALYIEELHIFLRVKTSLVDLENAIKPLLDSTIVFYSEGLYALHPDHIQIWVCKTPQMTWTFLLLRRPVGYGWQSYY